MPRHFSFSSKTATLVHFPSKPRFCFLNTPALFFSLPRFGGKGERQAEKSKSRSDKNLSGPKGVINDLFAINLARSKLSR
jgi:hypothetical protein